MKFSTEQQALLDKYPFKRFLGSWLRSLVMLLLSWVIIGGLVYTTLVTPAYSLLVNKVEVQIPLHNLARFGVVILFLCASLIGVVSLGAMFVAAWQSVQVDHRKTKKSHEFFMLLQKNGLPITGLNILGLVSDLTDFFTVIALVICGWPVIAFLYLGAWLTKVFCMRLVLIYTRNYFSNLTPEEITKLENGEDVGVAVPKPLHELIEAMNQG